MKWLIILSFILSSNLHGQGVVFTAEVSTDHVEETEVFELTFMIKNGAGDFTPPLLEYFDIVGGPNVSSSMQIINGDITREKSYTYYIRAKAEGEWAIESAHLFSKEGELISPELLISVGPSSNTQKRLGKTSPSDSNKGKTRAEILKGFKKRKI